MAPTLYALVWSPAVRAVILCAKALNVDLKLTEVNILKEENLTSEYIRLNPLHTVPTLEEDDGFILYDSHAIMPYLVEKYGKDKSLYPSDLRKRSTVNQRLHFDSSILFARGLTVSKGIIFKEQKKISQEDIDAIVESYGFVEKFLENSNFVAGDDLTVADFSVVTSVTGWDVLVPFDESKYPKTRGWIKRMASLPYYEEVQKQGLEVYRELVTSKLSS